MTALPLSGCPLKRLEIHGGSTHSSYDAANLDSSLTATLEAQRSTTGNDGNLLLQTHLGLQRILSIQLADLNETPNSERESLRIHDPSFSISINIRRIQQNVVISFERRQDFNHAIAILKRLGYHARDDVRPPSQAIDPTDTTAQSDPEPYSSHNFGPRLSLFTPSGSEAQQLSESKFSFTSMLNSDTPLAQLLPLGTINQSRKMYQPRISSPLRHAVPVNGQSEAPNLPMLNGQPTLFTDYTDITSLSSHRSISEPNSLSDHSQLSQASVKSYDTSLDHQFVLPSSQESFTSVESSSQATDTTDDTYQLQLGQDFRKLMPRTRSLPFLKGKDHKVAKSKPSAKQNQRRGTPREKKTIEKNADVHRKEITQAADSNDDDSQLVLHHTPPRSNVSQASDTPTYHSSFEETKLSTMLITDPTLLERANKATSHLFDQYNEDLSRGCNAASYAEYYLKQIHAVRIEFWLNELRRLG